MKLWLCGLLVLSLLICMCWPEIFCVKALVLSAHMYVLAFQDQHTLPKWNILSLLIQAREKAMELIWSERIFHFWEDVLVLEGQYIHTSRENNSFETEYFWPIHTYIHMSKERERNRWISYHLVVRKTVSGLPFKKWAAFKVYSQQGKQRVCVSVWMSKTLHK